MESKECQALMDKFIQEKPEIWLVDSPGHAKSPMLSQANV